MVIELGKSFSFTLLPSENGNLLFCQRIERDDDYTVRWFVRTATVTSDNYSYII
jgi:hypothetical protein